MFNIGMNPLMSGNSMNCGAINNRGMMPGMNINMSINIFDKTNFSGDLCDKAGSMPNFSNMGLGSQSMCGGLGSGQGMMPGFGGSCNQMGSMFGGMIQQQQQMMQMMMMMMAMMMMMKNASGNCPQAQNAGQQAPVQQISGQPSASAPAQSSSAPQTQGSSGSVSAPSGQKMGVAKGTGYYPDSSAMEGGYVDKQGKKLCTLQDFLAGKADYVSIALDKNLYKNGTIKYGDTFRIPELEAKYGRQIPFKAVDTGGAFTNKGFGRVDICTGSRKDSLDSTVNGNLTLMKQ